jgi:S1-C subfamily serine protease
MRPGKFPRGSRSVLLIGLTACLLIGSTIGRPADFPNGRATAADTPRPGDDATYRPTVMIRRSKSIGSGTIISSVEGETLILTASHVVEGSGPLTVEVFRFNLGFERSRDASGFPRKLVASIVARDVDADLAIIRIKGQLAFPYVARMASGEDEPPNGTTVTTIGFDKGEKLIGFSTRIKNVERIDLDKGGGDRPFLVTDHPPEHGRSGGGLFRTDGALVGVCVGRAELMKGRKFGLFTSLSNVRVLVRANEEIMASLVRSNARPRSPAR